MKSSRNFLIGFVVILSVIIIPLSIVLLINTANSRSREITIQKEQHSSFMLNDIEVKYNDLYNSLKFYQQVRPDNYLEEALHNNEIEKSYSLAVRYGVDDSKKSTFFIIYLIKDRYLQLRIAIKNYNDEVSSKNRKIKNVDDVERVIRNFRSS